MATETCSCTGDGILSTCYSGDTCKDDGNCCSADGCKIGETYIPEAYFFNNCSHDFGLGNGACKYTDGVTSNYDGSVTSCCCLDQNIGTYNNSDLCWISD